MTDLNDEAAIGVRGLSLRTAVTDPHKLPNAEFKILTKNSFEADPEFRWYLPRDLLLPARLWHEQLDFF
jgi:hypothetical protein